MDAKRRRPSDESQDHGTYPRKRAHLDDKPETHIDAFSRLPNELIIRILSYLTERQLLLLTPTSHRFRSLACDSQLWRVHYYRRFILPRAHRIPGFKNASAATISHNVRNDSKLYYSAQKSIWADGGFGKRGGFVEDGEVKKGVKAGFEDGRVDLANMVDWKREYKLQHNWALGDCELGEVQVRATPSPPTIITEAAQITRDTPPQALPHTPKRTGRRTMPTFGSSQTLVKVVDGIAITVEAAWGLRSWELRTKKLMAEINLADSDSEPQPTALSIDTQRLIEGYLDISIGFDNGSFGVYVLHIPSSHLSFSLRHRHRSGGQISAIAYRYPYLFTATPKGFITLYSLAIPPTSTSDNIEEANRVTIPSEPADSSSSTAYETTRTIHKPTILTSLTSPSTKEPLALSIRQAGTSTIASIAYSFDSWSGWCIGIQDFDIRPSKSSFKPEVITSRVAYTVPTPSRIPATSPSQATAEVNITPPLPTHDDGPIRLSYSHPYLLATLPDNTLALHICTATQTSLTISPPLRLWGHTSGISDAEITPRGKAVSVSTRGEELRVWELEGRFGKKEGFSGRSVEVRPRRDDGSNNGVPGGEKTVRESGDDDGVAGGDKTRREWVGFDDEMVIVLKTEGNGKESLMIYDFA